MRTILENPTPETRVLFDRISRRCGKAITDYRMIVPDDRILIAVSGGKDSLTLLNVLRHRRAVAPVDFKLALVHVENGMPGADLEKLEAYFKTTGLPYDILRTDTFRQDTPSATPHPDLNCFWCSWNRRKALFELARNKGFNKIALGHHLDDVVETILLNQFFRGEISAMCPRQEIFDGKLTLIRPLALEQESMIMAFAKAAGLNAFESCRCPRAGNTQRAAVKAMLREFERITPTIKTNIFRSLSNIKNEYLFAA